MSRKGVIPLGDSIEALRYITAASLVALALGSNAAIMLAWKLPTTRAHQPWRVLAIVAVFTTTSACAAYLAVLSGGEYLEQLLK